MGEVTTSSNELITPAACGANCGPCRSNVNHGQTCARPRPLGTILEATHSHTLDKIRVSRLKSFHWFTVS